MKKLLWIVIGIIVSIYIISLHPLTGFAGGVIFFLTWWFIPTLFNILLTCALVFYYTGRLPLVFKLILLVPVAFIVGMNVKLLEFGSWGCIIEEVSIIKPLHMSSTPRKDMHIFMHKPDNLEIKSSPFEDFRIFGDFEVWGGWFFKAPRSLLDCYDLSSVVRKIIGQPSGRFYPRFDKPEKTDYFLFIETKLKGKRIFVKLTLQDKKGGHIIIKSTYPRTLCFINDFKYIEYKDTLKSRYFWRYVFQVLINNNVWQWMCDERLKHAKDPITTLLESKEYSPSMLLNPQMDLSR